MPLPRSHDTAEETVEVGVTRLEDGGVSWELRVCGVPHGHGRAASATAALHQAAFVLGDEADRAASGGQP